MKNTMKHICTIHVWSTFVLFCTCMKHICTVLYMYHIDWKLPKLNMFLFFFSFESVSRGSAMVLCTCCSWPEVVPIWILCTQISKTGIKRKQQIPSLWGIKLLRGLGGCKKGENFINHCEKKAVIRHLVHITRSFMMYERHIPWFYLAIKEHFI